MSAVASKSLRQSARATHAPRPSPAPTRFQQCFIRTSRLRTAPSNYRVAMNTASSSAATEPRAMPTIRNAIIA